MLFIILASIDTTAPPIIELDVWDKLAILSAAALFLVLVIFCLICSLSPICWLHQFCPFQYEEVTPAKQISPVGFYGSTDIPRPPWSVEPKGKGRGRLGSLKEHDYSSEMSDSSAGNVIELKRATRGGSPSIPNGSLYPDDQQPTLSSGVVVFSLKYDEFENTLSLKVVEVKDMVVQDLNTIISPYIRIRFYRSPKQLFTFGRDYVTNNLDMELQTKIQKASDNLVFNEVFEIQMEQKNLKLYTIKLQLCDLDRFSRHVILGETTLNLKKQSLPQSTEVIFSETLQPPVEEDLGEIYLGVNYLPTAEKLYVTIAKARGLRIMDRKTNAADTYVKVVLMYEGRQLKKTKTTVRPADLNPEYDETFAFDVPGHQLNHVYFCVAVIHVDKEANEHKLLARMYFGPSFSADAHAHWLQMTQNPRKQVTCWHKLHY